MHTCSTHENRSLTLTARYQLTVLALLAMAGLSPAAVEECTQEMDGVASACAGCKNEAPVSYECPAPWPADEFCVESLVDNTGCEETTPGCPNNLIIWTDTNCQMGMGTSHQTTTACSTKFTYNVATNAGGVQADCDGQ